jgi:hypothetical protein
MKVVFEHLKKTMAISVVATVALPHAAQAVPLDEPIAPLHFKLEVSAARAAIGHHLFHDVLSQTRR